MSQENQAQEIEITPVDIINSRQIIKIAMERGNTFTAEELVEISQVFAKLDAFSKDYEARAKAAQEEQDAQAPEA